MGMAREQGYQGFTSFPYTPGREKKSCEFSTQAVGSENSSVSERLQCLRKGSLQLGQELNLHLRANEQL